jgi:hypothetical protein
MAASRNTKKVKNEAAREPIIPFNTFTLLQPIKHASTILYTTIIDQLNAILISSSHIAD